jgi:hypothetical protein
MTLLSLTDMDINELSLKVVIMKMVVVLLKHMTTGLCLS